MKRVINGEDILFAIGEIDEKLLTYPTKAATRATIFKKMAVACITVAVCITLVFAALNPGAPTLDKNDGAAEGGNSMMGESNNSHGNPSNPTDPGKGDNDATAILGALRIEKDGSFENYTENGNNYLHLKLSDGILRVMISTELEKPSIKSSNESGETVYNLENIESGYYTIDIAIRKNESISIYSGGYSYIFEVTSATSSNATLVVVSVKNSDP